MSVSDSRALLAGRGRPWPQRRALALPQCEPEGCKEEIVPTTGLLCALFLAAFIVDCRLWRRVAILPAQTCARNREPILRSRPDFYCFRF